MICIFFGWEFISIQIKPVLDEFDLKLILDLNIKQYKQYKTKVECQKVKCKADCNKNWAKSIKYASCTSSTF